MRGRIMEEILKELKDLDPISSPHLEEILIGGNVDIDLLSLFYQNDSRSIGGMGRKQAQEVLRRRAKMSSRDGGLSEIKPL
jgi:hypothetical protein